MYGTLLSKMFQKFMTGRQEEGHQNLLNTNSACIRLAGGIHKCLLTIRIPFVEYLISDLPLAVAKV